MSRVGSHHLHAGVTDDHHYMSAGNAGGRALTTSHDAANNGTLMSLVGDNAAGKLLYNVRTLYKNHDKCSDQQKAAIWVAVLMAAASIVAAIVHMFLR